MEAPECGNCVCGVSKIGYRCGASIMQNSKWIPGTACPFMTINTLESDLATKDAEIEKLRSALQRIIDVDENWQIEEYGGIQREALETTIARAALKEVK